MADGKRLYELVYILNPELRDEERDGANQKVLQSIARVEGTVTFKNHWGLRRFAYPIAKKNQGYYVLLHIETAPTRVADMERLLNLDENVMRYLITHAADQ